MSLLSDTVSAPAAAVPPIRSWRKPFVLTVLFVSLGLRLFLVGRGGALFWTDEKRIYGTREAIAAAAAGDWSGARTFLLSTSEHIGFRWLTLPPAIVERWIYGDDPPHGRLCSGWFALFSAANLWLIWLIARRAGTRRFDAEWALVFAAASNALFYFSRHCVPYDAALTAFLGAMCLTVGPRGRWTSLLVGLACGAGYLIYNGYWSVGGVVCVLEMAAGRVPLKLRLRRGVAVLAGLLLPTVAVFGVARACGFDLLRDSFRFAHTVNQGDFGIGMRFIAEYLFVADGGLVVGLSTLVLAACVAVAVRWVRTRLASGRTSDAASTRHADDSGLLRQETWLRWVGAMLLLVAIWVFFSDVRPTFVLYGRTVRAVIPFLALGAAGALLCLQDLMRRNGSRSGRHAWRFARALVFGIAVAACVGGAIEMMQPLRQMFPAEFRQLAEQTIADVRRQEPDAAFHTLFSDYQYFAPENISSPPHRVLLRFRHPQQYLPYLFEGYSKIDRERYTRNDGSMRLLQIDRSAPAPVAGARYFGNNHGPIELTVIFPPGPAGRAETLLAAGAPGRAEELFVSYVDPTHVSLGIGHWGSASLRSDPIAIVPGEPQRIVVSMGALFPSQEDPCYDDVPELRYLERWLYVKLNDAVVFSRAFDFFPCAADTLTIGRNSVGGSNADPVFTGKIVAVSHPAPHALGLAEPLQAWPPLRGERLAGGYLGKVRLTVRLPTRWEVGREPLLVSGALQNTEVVYARYVGSNRLRLGYRRVGFAPVLSTPFAVVAGTTHTVTIAVPSLYPPGDRHSNDVEILFDDQVVLRTPARQTEGAPRAVYFGHFTSDTKTYRMRYTGEILGVDLVP